MSGKAALVAVLVLLLAGGAAGYYFMAMKGGGGNLPAEALSIPGEATLVVGLDVKALLTSTRKLLDGEFGGLPVPPEAKAELPKMKEGFEKGLKEAEAKTGLKLDQDIEKVVLGIWDASGREPSVAAVVVGRFDRGKLGTAIEGLMKEEGKTPETKELHGAKLFTQGDGSLALVSDRVVVAGQAKAVETVLANLAAGTQSLSANANLMTLTSKVPSGATFWMVASEGFMNSMKKQMGRQAPPFALPKSFLMSESANGMELVAQMPDAESAKGLAGMITMGLAAAKAQGQDGAELLKDFNPEVVADGSDLRLTLKMPGVGGAMGAGVIAAMAIPSLLRARVSANEAVAIGDVRTVISAEAAYESTAGHYGELRCLSEPRGCLPDYPETAPTFLDTGLTSLADKNGYKRSFFPGPADGSGLSSFAYTAVPAEPGQTGRRSFCGDATGVVCAHPDGSPFEVTGGVCPATCEPLL